MTTVPPEGSPAARFILVGEAPGAHEARKGQPFVGPAGRVLNKLLAQADIARSDCYILNTIPVPEKPDNYIAFSKKDVKEGMCKEGKAWVSLAFKNYRDALIERINNSSAIVVIPLGRVALYALTGHTDITKRRGSILSSPCIPGKKIIPTIHPSATFQQFLYEYYIRFDLERAAEESTFEGLCLPERRLIIDPTFSTCMEYINECMKHPRVGYDIETTRTRVEGKFVDWEISCLSLSYDTQSAICIPFLDLHRQPYFDPEQELEIWKALKKLLEAPNISKVMQGGTFDMSFTFKKYGIIVWPAEDTMIAQGLLTPEFPKDLGFITTLHTREPYYKDEGKQHIRFASGSWHDFEVYSAKDAAVLLEIFESQEAQLRDEKLWETYTYQRDLLQPLVFMNARGILVDKDARTLPSGAMGRKLEELTETFKKLCGMDINPNSPTQIKNYFYKVKGLRPFIKKGKVSTDVDALTRLAVQGHTEASVLLEIRELAKIKGTYIDMGLDDDNRLRSYMNPIGARTGRLSSSKTIFNTGGNIQNIPHDMRTYMIADPGYVIYNVDLAQAENRIVAYIAPELTMMEAFEDGTDLHSLTASKISGLPIEEVKAQYKADIMAPIGGGRKPWRYFGKQANHALNYGLGPRKFSLRIETTELEAKQIRAAYFSVYPGIIQYHEWVKTELRRSRTLVNPFGRYRKFYDRNCDALHQAAYAHIPQSTVGDIINRWGLIPIYADNEKFRHVELLNQVHDSIVYQVPLSAGWGYHASTLLAIKELLERPLEWKGRRFTIPIDAGLGINFRDLYSVDIKETDQTELASQLEQIYEERCC